MLVAGEEHPVHRPPGALQTRPGLGAGEDHHISSRHANHQLARHRALDVVPEVVD
jgi:hypothetical protein